MDDSKEVVDHQTPDEEQWTDVCQNCTELEERIIQLEKQVSTLISQVDSFKELASSTKALQEQNRQLIDRLNKIEQKIEPSFLSSVINYVRSFFANQSAGKPVLENESSCCTLTSSCAPTQREPTVTNEPFVLQQHVSPSHIADLIEEQSQLERDLSKFDEANRVPLTLENLKENDVVETITHEALNFGDAFQHSQVLDQIDSIPNILLAARYYFPCVVTSVTDDNVTLHYFGYQSGWDFTLPKSRLANRLRPLPIVSREEKAQFEAGDDVEVRLLQKTNIDDDYTKQAYCWVRGKILSMDDKSALVKLILDSNSTGIEQLVVGNSNKFIMKGMYPGGLGFERVKVCLQALRKLEKPYPE